MDLSVLEHHTIPVALTTPVVLTIQVDPVTLEIIRLGLVTPAEIHSDLVIHLDLEGHIFLEDLMDLSILRDLTAQVALSIQVDQAIQVAM